MLIFKLLASYLTLGHTPPADDNPDAGAGAGGDGAEPPDKPDGAGADGDDVDPDLSALDDDDEPDAAEQLATERAARAKAERELAESRSRFEAEQRARSQPPQPSQEERIRAAEEARLADPQISDQERWQIEANRSLRPNHQASQQALFRSREIADKAEYERLCDSNPLAKKYATRVEEKLTEVRRGGQNVERKFVLKLLIGDDLVEGRVKSSKKKDPGTGTEPAAGTTVPRGKPAMARSDVRGRAGNSERDKRRARLDGQLI